MPRSKDGGGFSGPLSVIAVVGIALGVTVMVMAVSILRGFQQDITDKVVGFGSHMTVCSYDRLHAYAETPIEVDSVLIDSLRTTQGVRHVQAFATKGGMVKTEEQIYGILLRGLSADYDTTFYASCLVDGHLPATTNEVLISTTIGNKLKLNTGDKMRTYFWQGNSYRARAFTVSGLYNTDLTEMDELYILGDLRQVQRLNDWDSTQVGGYELLVDDFDHLNKTCSNILNAKRVIGNDTLPLLPYDLMLTTITQAHPALFSWLDLLNTNITLILAIMCLVCAVAIVSALLIMIFEKSATIGLLKALGATNRAVRRIFLMKATRLILCGIAIGDAAALALSLVQRQWQVVQLDPESYSMTHVPVQLDPWIYLTVSAATLAVCLLALLLPVASVSRINPAKTMRTER